MTAKTIISTLLIATIVLVSIFSFTKIEEDTTDLVSYNQSHYDTVSDLNPLRSLHTETLQSDKCGGDKKDAKNKDPKEETKKCGADANVKKDRTTKCGEGKCGGDKKAKDDKKADSKKDDEGKEAKCGTGKCG